MIPMTIYLALDESVSTTLAKTMIYVVMVPIGPQSTRHEWRRPSVIIFLLILPALTPLILSPTVYANPTMI
jgi:hypothetical protein